MFPAHEVYQTLIDIWSGGCNPHLRYSLPILFAWEVSSFMLSSLGVFRRCHFAVLGEERQEKEFKERVDTAVSFRVAGMAGRSGRLREGVQESRGDEAGRSSVADAGDEMKRKGTEERAPSEIESAPAVTEDGDTEDEEAGETREGLQEIMERVSTRQRREREREGVDADWNFGPAFQLPFSQESDGEDTP